MLTGEEIIHRYSSGDIYIDNFDEKKVNPNSYNLTLANKLKVYATQTYPYSHEVVPLDMKADNHTREIIIPEEGLVLIPGTLYIGSTNEYTMCRDLIPCIDGRSSIGRLGICIHVTAGFGDVGFEGKWTLEITVVHPIRIYPNCEICQIYYEEPVGSTGIKYNGKYQGQREATASKMYTDRSFDK